MRGTAFSRRMFGMSHQLTTPIPMMYQVALGLVPSPSLAPSSSTKETLVSPPPSRKRAVVTEGEPMEEAKPTCWSSSTLPPRFLSLSLLSQLPQSGFESWLEKDGSWGKQTSFLIWLEAPTLVLSLSPRHATTTTRGNGILSKALLFCNFTNRSATYFSRDSCLGRSDGAFSTPITDTSCRLPFPRQQPFLLSPRSLPSLSDWRRLPLTSIASSGERDGKGS